MKSLLLLIFCVQTLLSNAQDQNNLGKRFTMKSNYSAQTCDGVGNPVTPVVNVLLEREFIVIVDAVMDSGYVVSLPTFGDSAIDKKYVKKGNDYLYFLIAVSKFSKVCEKFTSKYSFTLGIPTIPAKLRFGNGGTGPDARYFRFEGNISLGLSGGFKYSFGDENQYAINTVVGFTIASVQVDSITTKGKVNSLTAAASFSPHLGAVFEVEKFQFGIYTGIDFLYGAPNKYWVYRNQPWLGIGLGYSLFKTESAGNNSVKNP